MWSWGSAVLFDERGGVNMGVICMDWDGYAMDGYGYGPSAGLSEEGMDALN